MKKLVIEFSNERLITPSGLSLVGQMLGKSNFIKMCNNMKVDGKRSQSQIKNGDILLSYIGLLCQGKTSYDAINEMSDDPEYYKLALGITRAIPSAETEYYVAAEPPVRCGESHHSGQTEPPYY